MAFGESFGSILDRTAQVEKGKDWPVGKLGETVFDTSDSPIAVSILYIFDVSPFFPGLITLLNSQLAIASQGHFELTYRLFLFGHSSLPCRTFSRGLDRLIDDIPLY